MISSSGTNSVNSPINPNKLELTSKPKLEKISDYFVKDMLHILDDSSIKGKTKLKKIRKSILEYLKKF